MGGSERVVTPRRQVVVHSVMSNVGRFAQPRLELNMVGWVSDFVSKMRSCITVQMHSLIVCLALEEYAV
jgi:hypothetical protein